METKTELKEASDGLVNIVLTQQSNLDEGESLFQVAKKLLMQLQHERVFPLTVSRLFWMIHRPHCPQFSLELLSTKEIVHV